MNNNARFYVENGQVMRSGVALVNFDSRLNLTADFNAQRVALMANYLTQYDHIYYGFRTPSFPLYANEVLALAEVLCHDAPTRAFTVNDLTLTDKQDSDDSGGVTYLLTFGHENFGIDGAVSSSVTFNASGSGEQTTKEKVRAWVNERYYEDPYHLPRRKLFDLSKDMAWVKTLYENQVQYLDTMARVREIPANQPKIIPGRSMGSGVLGLCVEELEPIPSSANPFRADAYHMGVSVGSHANPEMTVMYDSAFKYIILCFHRSGRRMKVHMDDALNLPVSIRHPRLQEKKNG